MSVLPRPLLGLVMLLALIVSPAAPALAQPKAKPTSAQAQPQQKPPQKLVQFWADFNHYVLIARPDLAAAAGKALLKESNPTTLLEVVESGTYKNYAHNLDVASHTKGVAEVAQELAQKIQAARISVARNPKRIANDIELLPQGGRPYRNALARLRAAGQFAAPQLLETLRDSQKTRLHPYVIQALIAIGQPVVQPLSVALPHLSPAVQTQVARILAQIGYPMPALPYLAQLKEGDNTSAPVKQAAGKAYGLLLSKSGLPQNLAPADLFLLLGEMRYRQETQHQAIPGYDSSQGKGIVWEFGQDTGLVPAPVPGPIYGDVLAMRATRNSLELNPSLDSSLSVWLAANLRRENQLPKGEKDPTYGPQMRPPSYYAMLAGPLRLQDVLSRALDDADSALALDAIDALSRTAGTAALINQGAARQPLLTALSYPDARVRFRAAQALAHARPQEQFPGSYRVIPVIAQAIRPNATRYALVIADTQQRVNDLLARVGKQGFQAVGGLSLGDVSTQIEHAPAIDLIVIDLAPTQTERLLNQTRDDYKLGSTPILAVVSPDRQLTLQEKFHNQRRLITSADTGKADTLAAAIKRTMNQAGATVLSDKQKKQFALAALNLLHQVALGHSVYHAMDAQAALIGAMSSNDEQIVTLAGRDLALLNSSEAQNALAKAALAAKSKLQIALLNSLGESATQFGNLLTKDQVDQLLALVKSATGETAVAAARAHGALTLPTSDAVKMILK